jgi:protein-S-isoprenylcysteine O-methyltransferase Ste14
MGKKMSIMGEGGKILIVLIISLVITESISYVLNPLFKITDNYQSLIYVAVVMIVVGFSLNLLAAFTMLRAYRKNQLATTGLYAVFIHPMYVFQILLTVPGLLLFFNSWLVLVAILPLFIAYKVFAKEEENYLKEKFAQEYTDYRQTVRIKFL